MLQKPQPENANQNLHFTYFLPISFVPKLCQCNALFMTIHRIDEIREGERHTQQEREQKKCKPRNLLFRHLQPSTRRSTPINAICDEKISEGEGKRDHTRAQTRAERGPLTEVARKTTREMRAGRTLAPSKFANLINSQRPPDTRVFFCQHTNPNCHEQSYSTSHIPVMRAKMIANTNTCISGRYLVLKMRRGKVAKVVTKW